MSIFQRLRYALYLHIAITMIVFLSLSLASADAIAMIPSINLNELMMSPLYIGPVYALCYVAAPWVSELFPINRGRNAP